MKKTLFFILLSFITLIANAQSVTTYEFVQRGEEKLYMDVYQPETQRNNVCVIFVFGGGFITGSRDAEKNVIFAKELAEKGYVVANIDYRLGLKGVKKMGISQVKVLENAIQIATDDLFAATSYLINHAAELQVDTSKIVICGSSAGAITVLQADYELCNAFDAAKVLPSGFHYAGVVPFSGAIFSRKGKVKYCATAPAPTLFLHGTADNLVTYKQIKFANIGFFGANPLVKRFQKFDYPYYVRRYDGLGHEVAGFMSREIDLFDWFVKTYVVDKQMLQIDEWYHNPSIKPADWGKMKPSALYNEESD